jgi:hypothetical protein
MVLTAERVDELAIGCLSAPDAPDQVLVEGIISQFGFNREILESHRDEITGLLAELPDEFKKSGGGGWSFLNACQDRDGNQWTGMHWTMERLFALGMGLGLVQSLMPRDLWKVLPGGVPYYMVVDC